MTVEITVQPDPSVPPKKIAVEAHELFEWRGYKFAVTKASPIWPGWVATELSTGMRFGTLSPFPESVKAAAIALLDERGLAAFERARERGLAQIAAMKPAAPLEPSA